MFCKFCSTEKSNDRFSIKNHKTGRRNTKCKDCHNTYVRDVWYKKNKDKQIASNKEWKAHNKDKVLLQRYGFSDIIDCREHLSNTTCEICGDNANLVFDHCHKSNKYRGTICSNCNKGLGFFKDNINILSSAIKYLS